MFAIFGTYYIEIVKIPTSYFSKAFKNISYNPNLTTPMISQALHNPKEVQ